MQKSAAERLDDEPSFDLVAFQRLTGLSDSLSAWVTDSEAVFLDAGARLQVLHSRVSQVRDGIRRSTELFTTPEMSGMRAGLAAAVDGSRSVTRLVEERGEALAALRSAIEEATTGSASVRLVFRMLDYIVLIARAQVETMKSGQEDLVPFALHVDELVTTGEKVARTLDERMQSLGGHLDESRHIEARAGASGSVATLMEGFLQLMSLLELQQNSAAAQRDEAQEAFTRVWKAIAGVVMGLQAHDNARQRFEHTARNLVLLGRIAEDGSMADEGERLPLPLRGAATRRIALLEIAQLEDLAETYGGKMGALNADLEAIAGELESCIGILLRLRPGQADDRGLTSLDAEATRLRIGFREGDAVRQRLGESLDRSVEATSSLIEMTGKLADLEHDLRLAGFNAAVRAAHVDGGDQTIVYIARVIREQASKAREEADRVRHGIETAMRLTEGLSARILPEVAEGERLIESTLTAAATLLSGTEAACREILTESTAAASGLGQDIAVVGDMMRSHEEGCEMMRALSAAIAALAAALPDADLPEPERARLDAILSGPYTMVEERTVFARALGGAGPDGSAAAGPAAAAAEEDLDDILF